MLKELRAAPNLLTFLRLCLIPFLVIAVLEAHYQTALCLFVVAGLSDGLDGWAARVLKQQTQIGQYLDPVTDKLLPPALPLTGRMVVVRRSVSMNASSHARTHSGASLV